MFISRSRLGAIRKRIMSELVHDAKINIDDPRYDQNTYSGRGM